MTSTQDYIGQGKACCAEQRYAQALEYFQAAIENAPQDAEAYFGLAEAYYALGKTDLAISTLYRLLAIDPHNKKAEGLVNGYQSPKRVRKDGGENTRPASYSPKTNPIPPNNIGATKGYTAGNSQYGNTNNSPNRKKVDDNSILDGCLSWGISFLIAAIPGLIGGLFAEDFTSTFIEMTLVSGICIYIVVFGIDKLK